MAHRRQEALRCLEEGPCRSLGAGAEPAAEDRRARQGGAIRSRLAQATRTRRPYSRARAPSRSSVPLVAALAAGLRTPPLHSVIRHDAKRPRIRWAAEI
jgi:hypothetical protein